MASNTEILIKRSLANTTPTALNQGELAYSYASNTLFIGTPGSDGYLEIGGLAKDFSGNYLNGANTYGDTTHIPVITIAANGLITNVTTSEISTTLSISGDSGSNNLSLVTDTLTITGGQGITTLVDGNEVSIDVDDTVVRSNTEGSAQFISTDLSISGNLTVRGTTTYVESQVNQTNDSLIELAANNTIGDVVDIGFYGKHEYDGDTVITGLVRNAGTSDYYLFDNVLLGDQGELTSNIITQSDMSTGGASLYGKQFLASQGEGSNGGYSFSGNEGGLDTGMFSPADGQLDFYSNAQQIISANQWSTTTLTQAYFNQNATFNSSTDFFGSLDVHNGNQLQLNNSDNSTTAYIVNNGINSNTSFIIGDGWSEQDLLKLETNTQTHASAITLYNATDIRDGETGESLLVKGEQKYGVVTQFLVNGSDPVTEKIINDPNVPPAINDMVAVDLNTDHDDAYIEVVTPWNVNFNGTTYSSVFVGSNGYLTFGSGTGSNQHSYPPNANYPNELPALEVSLGDISWQRVYTFEDTARNTFRIRYEGDNIFEGRHIGSSSSIIWEVVFYGDVPGKFDVRIIRMNGTANDGTDGRWNTYLTDGGTFLDNRADRTIPWTTYTQFAKQLTNGTNTVELLDDGSLKLTNGTTISDVDSGLFIDPIREDGTSNDILYYNSDTKEVTYGTLADIRADVLSNGTFSWTISADNGSLTSNVGTSIAASANSVVIGESVDLTNPNYGRVAIGVNAGALTQSSEAIAIGDSAGYNSQGVNAIAIGYGAGNITQQFEALAIGVDAGNTNQGQHSIAIGQGAAYTNQNWSAIAIGQDAGADTQSFSAVAIGRWAGQTNQGWDSVAVGRRAGRTNQGSYAVAMGWGAADTNQGSHATAIGTEAGNGTQSAFAVAVGNQAGYITQGWAATAVGQQAGYDSQGLVATAIGSNAGRYSQSQGAVAVGRRAGETTQGYYATALGNRAGRYNQGQYSVAIGAYAGDTNQAQNSIVLNASGYTLDAATSGLFINPVAYTVSQDSTYDGLMFYNSSTKEVRYSYALDGGSF